MLSPSEIAEIARYADHFKLRFGQYLDNALVTQTDHSYDMFSIPDLLLLAACRAYYNAHKEEQHA